MRSVDRLIRSVCLGAACAALAACAMFDKAAAPAGGAPAEAKAAPAAATGKEAAPGRQARDAPDQPRRAARLRHRAPGTGRGADGRRRAGFRRADEVRTGALGPVRQSGPHLSPGRQDARGGCRTRKGGPAESAAARSAQPAGHHLPHGRGFREGESLIRTVDRAGRELRPRVLNLGILYDLYLWDGARALELYDRYLQLTPGGDEQVKRWVSDLRNRSTQKSAPQRKEQG